MTNPLIDQAIEIIAATNDGDDLSPEHLSLVEYAVNGYLNEDGVLALQELHQTVMQGEYAKPWFHGIEHLTIDHEGFVYWKGQRVEHYTLSWAFGTEAMHDAKKLAEACLEVEKQGKKVCFSACMEVWDAKKEVCYD